MSNDIQSCHKCAFSKDSPSIESQFSSIRSHRCSTEKPCMTTNTLVHHHAKGISWHFQGASHSQGCARADDDRRRSNAFFVTSPILHINKLKAEYMQLNDSPLDWKRRSALDKAGGLLLLRPPTTVCVAMHRLAGVIRRVGARETEAAGKFEKI